jgi:cysteine desulfurase
MKNGDIDLEHLKKLLSKKEKTLVSLMHVNNEIGNILPLQEVAYICKQNNALFHSDTVQSIAYFDIDVKKLQIDFLSCSAHKFHGPKGIGFLYASEKLNLSGYILGGNQEKGLRGGTENTVGVIGLEKALLNSRRNVGFIKLSELKQYLISELEENNFDYSINGSLNSSPSILNISFKTKRDVSMLLFNLDLEGIAISGGSACTSGSNIGSHVLKHIGTSMEHPAIRISFSTLNNKDEINQLIAIFKKLLHK